MLTTISVTKFNNIVKDIFNNEEFLHSVNVVGEVFGISRAKNAVYFSLKDEESTLPCVCFNSAVFGDVKEGDMVVLSGGPNFYTKSGRFNYITYRIEKAGQGILYQKFVELKNKLEKEGLFDIAHKKPLPKSIKRIGVVTSKEGAVLQDIKNVAWRRNPAVEIVLYPTKVQGNDAEKEIVEGINFFSTYDKVDVVVVARGGGSMEDLSAYNTEVVARATYNCLKPIVSAVGHETDFTIIDFVSDLRAPTPSAAAEILTQDTEKERSSFRFLVKKLSREMMSLYSDRVEDFLDNMRYLTNKIEDYVFERYDVLKEICEKISYQLEKQTDFEKHRLELLSLTLQKLDPLAILRRGYAKVEQNGKSVESVLEISEKESLSVNFFDGEVEAKVLKKNFKENL